MKLKLDFVTKVPKVAKDNQVILLNNKSAQNKIVKSLNRIISQSLATLGTLVTKSNFSFIFLKYLIDNVVYLLNL